MIASPARRFLAFLLDVVFNYILAFVLAIAMMVPLLLVTDEGADEMSRGVTVVYILTVAVAMLLIQYLFWRKGTSIGKAILHMRVVDINTLEPIGFWKMFFREMFVKEISGVVFFIGYIWILFDENRQSWHDKILSTIVLSTRSAMNCENADDYCVM